MAPNRHPIYPFLNRLDELRANLDDSAAAAQMSAEYNDASQFDDPNLESWPDQSPSFTIFRKLPPELKVLVLKSAVLQPEPIDLSKKENQKLPEITRVSRFFHREGSRLYYHHNTFLIPLSGRMSAEDEVRLEAWLRRDSTAAAVTRMRKINVKIPFPPDKDDKSITHLLRLALHFQQMPIREAKRIINLQLISKEGDDIFTSPAVETALTKMVSVGFWRAFQGDLRTLSRGLYPIHSDDMEEMEAIFGVPLLENAFAMGRIAASVWEDAMRVWYYHQQHGIS